MIFRMAKHYTWLSAKVCHNFVFVSVNPGFGVGGGGGNSNFLTTDKHLGPVVKTQVSN